MTSLQYISVEILFNVFKRLDDRTDQVSLLSTSRGVCHDITMQCSCLTVTGCGLPLKMPPRVTQLWLLYEKVQELRCEGIKSSEALMLLKMTSGRLKRLHVYEVDMSERTLGAAGHAILPSLPELRELSFAGGSPNPSLLTSERLERLQCKKYPDLTSLPLLPAGLRYLDCSDCIYLTSLPPLPTGLQYLDCGFCRSLTSLPPLLAGLQYLDCRECDNLTSLHSLPAGLQYLDCRFCTSLTTLPPLPEGLKHLYCVGCENPDGPASAAGGTTVRDVVGRQVHANAQHIREATPGRSDVAWTFVAGQQTRGTTCIHTVISS